MHWDYADFGARLTIPLSSCDSALPLRFGLIGNTEDEREVYEHERSPGDLDGFASSIQR